MKNIKRFIAVLLLVVMLLPTFATKSAAFSGYYDSDWRYWSQGGSGIGGKVKSSGCYVVSQAKLLVESGIVDDLDSFDPDVYAQWVYQNGYFGKVQKKPITKYIGMQTGGDKAPQYYAEAKGKTLTYCGKKNISKMNRAEQNGQIMEWLKNGYYIIIGYTGHRLYILHDDSINKGTVVISNTQSAVANSTLAWADNQKKNPGKYIVADFMTWNTKKQVEYALLYSVENTSAVTTLEATDITETSACLNGEISSTGRSKHITEHGACIGTSLEKGQMGKAAADYVDHYKNTLSIFYTTSKYGTELNPGTTYYYYCYAVIDGETIEGEVKSFTTLGEPEPSEEPSEEPAEEPDTNNVDAPRVLVASYPDEGMYNFTPKCAPNNRLDVSGGSYSDKANIQSWEANGEDSQKFELKACGDGYYEIISYRSGKALDMSNGDRTSETNIWQYRRNGTVSQKWKFWQDSEGYYYIVPYLNDNLCMDVDGASSEIGANVWAYEKNYSDAQRWSLTSVAQSSVPAVKDYKDGIIGENDMRVRSGPGTSYKHIGTIPSGSVVQVYPEKQSGNWYYVKYNNLEGYVYKNGITIQ